MSAAETSEKLVQVHHARNEWEGNIVVGYLRENGIEAALRAPPTMPPLDLVEKADKVNGVFVLEHDATRAQTLLNEFQSTVTDPQLLEDEAAHKLKLDKETIAQLRGALKEEKKTFEFLGWISIAFLASAVLLWAIWPAWLKLAPPVARWAFGFLLVLAAVQAGSWASRRLK